MKLYPLVATVGIALGLTACEQIPLLQSPQSTVEADQAAEYYVLLQASQTSLRDVADDRENTYLDFSSVVPPAMEFYDGDVKPLKAIRDGGLVGIPGLHTGILIRLGQATSFVSVRAGASRESSERVIESPAIKRMRERLVAEGPAKEAMMKALAKLELGNVPSGAVGNGRAATNTASPLFVARSAPVSAPAVETATKSVDWRSSAVPAGGAKSGLDAEKQAGYISFIANSLQPIAAEPVVAAFKKIASNRNGVLLISGIAPSGARNESVDLAESRAEFIQRIFVEEGLDKAKTTVTAVYRTDTHRQSDPDRPAETVNLMFVATPNR